MRKMVLMLIMMCVGCFFATFNLPATLRAANSLYSRTCLVTDCGEGYVTVDTGNHAFEFEGDGFRMGQVIKVTFSDNDTPYCVEDDVIVSAESETFGVRR